MRPSEILEQKGTILLDIAPRYHVVDIYVFGSVARGSDTDASDLDIYVTYQTDASILTHAAFSAAVEKILSIECDVLCDEMANLDTFRNLKDICVPLKDWLDGKRNTAGFITEEDRKQSNIENLEWIIGRISETTFGISFEQFQNSPSLYDSAAYRLMLLSDIVDNSQNEEICQIERKYQIDLSGCQKLRDLLMTSIYPRMVYNAACKLKSQ